MASRRRTAGAGGSLILVIILAILGYTYVPGFADLANGVSGWIANARGPDLPDSGVAGSRLASDVLNAFNGAAVTTTSGGAMATSQTAPTTSSDPTTDQPDDPSLETAGPAEPAAAADPNGLAPGSALAALAELPVKDRAPMTGYSRDQFGPAWTDDTSAPLSHNGCDTRNDILQRDLTDVMFKSGHCVVASGELADPYSGTDIDFVRGQDTSGAVQIDHRVALANAWVTGAQQLSPEERADFANDPLNLQATSGPLNQAKADGDAATWLPPNEAYRCAYVAAQVGVKIKFGLWLSPPEHDAIVSVLAECPDQRLPVPAK